MVEQDTIRLLRECDAGVKMGVSSIEDVLDNVKKISAYLVAKLEELKKWTDIIRSVDIFVSKPIYTYDQNGECERFVRLKDSDSYTVCKVINQKASTSTYPMRYQKHNMHYIYSLYHNNFSTIWRYRLKLPSKSVDAVKEDIRSCSQFYLLESMKIDQLSTTRIAINVEEDYLQSLVTREVMTDDYDSFYIQYDIGRIRTRGFEVVRNRLKKVGLYKDEQLKDRCMVFRLKNRLTGREVEKLEQEEAARQLAVNSIVKVTFVDPALYQKLVEVATRLHRVCYRRMDKLSSATNGERMVKLIDETIRIYYKMAECGKNQPKDLLPYWEEMRQMLHKLLIELQIVAGLKLWTRENCVKIGESIMEMQNKVDRQIRRGAS